MGSSGNQSKSNPNRQTDNKSQSRYKSESIPKPTINKIQDVFKQVELFKMPCGHYITQTGMQNYMKSLITEKKAYIVSCPLQQCSQQWQRNMCYKVASFKQDLQMQLNLQIAKNYCFFELRSTQCPQCSFVIQLSQIMSYKVKCPSCKSKKQFCRLCRSFWTEGHQRKCQKSINQYLSQTSIRGQGLIQFPARRACPKCLMLNEITAGCKHGSCLNCKLNFCFRCLAPKNPNYGWKNDEHNEKCRLAPIQRF